MPLTKSEFDRWKAQKDQATEAIKARPMGNSSWIDINGDLVVIADTLNPDQTRALYEMLRAWYGEATMTETAKDALDSAIAYIDASPGYMCVPKYEQMKRALDAYRAEQKQ